MAEESTAKKAVVWAITYTVAGVVLIAAGYWAVTRVLITNSQLEFMCVLDCQSRCTRMDLPTGGRPVEGLPRRLEPGGPSCGEICEDRCGNRTILSPTTRIFFDNFEADVVGSPPAIAPAGEPYDDQLSIAGVSGTAVVIGPAVVPSKACRIDRGSYLTATVLDLVAGGGGPHTRGKYSIRWRGYAEASEAALRVTLLSSSAKRAFELQLLKTSIRLTSGSGAEMLSATFADGVVHSFEVGLDLDSDRFRVSINGNAVATDKPFIEADFEDLRMLRLQYVEAIVEALRGTYVIDEAIMERT